MYSVIGFHFRAFVVIDVVILFLVFSGVVFGSVCGFLVLGVMLWGLGFRVWGFGFRV